MQPNSPKLNKIIFRKIWTIYIYVAKYKRFYLSRNAQIKEKTLSCDSVLVGASGLEPPTPTLSGWCSNLLSYAPI